MEILSQLFITEFSSEDQPTELVSSCWRSDTYIRSSELRQLLHPFLAIIAKESTRVVVHIQLLFGQASPVS